MSKQDDGGPAFPAKVSINRETGKLIPHQFGSDDFCTEGMSLRDHFAGLAMQSFCAGATGMGDLDRQEVVRQFRMVADFAFILADQMVEAREV